MSLSIQSLRRQALQQTLFPPTSLPEGVAQLGFIQADPIRFPARAQDLILRQRVINYKANDLEVSYPSLDLEEGYLYAYGFMNRSLWLASLPKSSVRLTKLDRQILEVLQQQPGLHPNVLAGQIEHKKVTNAWGGSSRSTKESLEKLHHYGLVRVSQRQKGLRVYDIHDAPPTNQQAQRQLILAILTLLSPVVETTLSQALLGVRRRHGDTRPMVNQLIKEGFIERLSVDTRNYLKIAQTDELIEIDNKVRFLAPFDPIVWDRLRFEQCWGWAYRFEAYTPPAKRQRGYYALPLLWGENVIGWANAINQPSGLIVEVGLVDNQDQIRVFEQELDQEVERLAKFLGTTVVARKFL